MIIPLSVNLSENQIKILKFWKNRPGRILDVCDSEFDGAKSDIDQLCYIGLVNCRDHEIWLTPVGKLVLANGFAA